jgi:hypothetical protein
MGLRSPLRRPVQPRCQAHTFIPDLSLLKLRALGVHLRQALPQIIYQIVDPWSTQERRSKISLQTPFGSWIPQMSRRRSFL